MRVACILSLLLMLSGCSGGASVVQGEGRRIGEIQDIPYDGPLKRIAIAPILDHTAKGSASAIVTQVGLLTGDDSKVSARDILSGVRDLLTTALFNTDRFILLEREGLDEVMTEQTFSAGEKSLPSTLQQQLEGAQYLLLGAVTAFDMGESGGVALPVPVRLNDRGDVGVLDVEMRTAHLAMDLRVVEVKTGRVVATTAVEGKTRKFGMAMAGFYGAHGGHFKLPGLLSVFNNTPMESATLKMVDTAAQQIVLKMFPEVAAERKRKEDEQMWQRLQ